MKNSKAARIQTTLGELILTLSEETEKLFNFKGNERPLLVAYILNDLEMKSFPVRNGVRRRKTRVARARD